jgi:hypothetical protein
MIVIHSGGVDVDHGLEDELRDLFEGGQAQTARYDQVKERLMAARAGHGYRLRIARRGHSADVEEPAGPFFSQQAGSIFPKL